MVPELFTVTERVQELDDTVTFELQPGQGVTPNGFNPGQFSMLYAFGAGEVPISIAGKGVNEHSMLFTIKAVGPITKLLARLKKNDTLGVRGPFGSSWPIEQLKDKDLLLIAGGLGIAPLRSVLQRIVAEENAPRSVRLLYGARTPNSLIYVETLDQWAETIEVGYSVDMADPAWKHHVGVVSRLIRQINLEPESTIAFICGPEVMMKLSAKELVSNGIREADIFVSLERNMKCATGFCGHCQLGPTFVCKDGPVFSYEVIKKFLEVREL